MLKGWIETVRVLLSPRGRAVVRADFPLAGFVPAFLVGQFLGLLPNGVGIGGAVLFGAMGFAGALMGWARMVAAGLALGTGVVSALAVSRGEPRPPPPARSYLAQVVEEPRYPRTGAVRLTLAVVPREGSGVSSPVRVACVAVDLPWRNINGVERGDVFAFRGIFTPLDVGFNPFRYEAMLARRGIGATCRITHATPILSRQRSSVDRARRAIERDVVRVLGPGESSGLVTALSIGARDTLSVGTERAFKSTGLAHLLVVSGFQVTVVFHLVAGFITWLLARSRWLLERIPARELGAVAGLGAALLFVAISGLEGASLRAGIAAVFVVVAAVLERGRGMLNGILVSLVGVSAFWPGAFLEPGVQLTYAALLGISLSLGDERGEISVGERIKAFCRLTVIVWACSSAVAVAWFGTIAPLGLMLNPLIAPLASVIGCQGSFFGYGAYALGLDSGGAILALVATALEAVRDIVTWCAGWGGVEHELYNAVRLGCVIGLGAVVSGVALSRCRGFFVSRGLIGVE